MLGKWIAKIRSCPVPTRRSRQRLIELNRSMQLGRIYLGEWFSRDFLSPAFTLSEVGFKGCKTVWLSLSEVLFDVICCGIFLG